MKFMVSSYVLDYPMVKISVNSTLEYLYDPQGVVFKSLVTTSVDVPAGDLLTIGLKGGGGR